jgi:hypothetical protein
VSPEKKPLGENVLSPASINVCVVPVHVYINRDDGNNVFIGNPVLLTNKRIVGLVDGRLHLGDMVANNVGFV